MTVSKRYYIREVAQEIAKRTGAEMPLRTLKYLIVSGYVPFSGRNPGPRSHRFWTEKDLRRVVDAMGRGEYPYKNK